ncbi:TRAP transporter substrate-binding protein [Sinisalibacter lacisalsi]|uniref:C4-dicarboxylate ABC transporter n=1 Tax=Sinisalibacter lacisalsi TaxID=1526570 RepID=A0ABQ1QQK0_9RHOB|nr:TRAP transporter substrate-binding protein DctP [Sinisalibacter lacisalsi]GGD38624.1 C4-dicarboxylate ABC transporter [Sinisalibacter lacisalsi]
MKRRDFLRTGALAAPAAALAAPAIAQGKIEWRLPTSFPAQAPGVGTNATTFAKRVEEMTDGQMSLKVFSAGELVPPFGVEDAVEQGTAEIGHSTPYYAASKNSAVHFFSAVPFGLTAAETTGWLRYGGGQELWNDLYAQRNLVPLYSGNSGVQAAGWFKTPIDSLDDLAGLNMRIAGLGGEAMRKVGVNAILMPAQEIFPAFQSGAIDAAEWVGPLLDQAFGLQKAANYCYMPAFHEPSAGLEVVVNKDAWDSLPANLQAILANAAEAAATETLAQFEYFNATAMQQLKDAGAEFRIFPDEVVAALKTASAEVMEENAAKNPDFAMVKESYDAFLALARPYGIAVKAPMFAQRA